MALYSIRTTRQQEVGLKFSYDHYADKTVYPTQESWFQYQIDQQVSDPMFAQQQASQVKSFDESFKTIPEAEQPAANTEIQTVITSHGGTIVPPAGITTVMVPQPPTGGAPPMPPVPEPPPPLGARIGVPWPPPMPPPAPVQPPGKDKPPKKDEGYE